MAKAAEIARRIRQIMQQRGMSQKELAEFLNVSQPAVSLYLQGRIPPAEVLYRLARLGNTSMEWILTGFDPRETSETVREPTAPYGEQEILLEIWEQLPTRLRKDLLNFLKHLLVWQQERK